MKLLLFILFFFFIYPIFPKFLPIPIDRVMQMGGFIVFCLHLATHNKDLKKFLSSKQTIKFYIVTFLLMAFCFWALIQPSAHFDLYVVKFFFDTIFYIFSAYLIYVVAKICYGEINFGILLYYISLTGVAQALISAIFFINPSIFNSYISLLNQDINQGYFARLGLINLRFMGIGSQFFTGGVKFGFAFFAMLFLPYFSNNKLAKNKYLSSLSLLLIIIGGTLTARTFLVAVAMGLIMIIKIKSKNIVEFIRSVFKIAIICILTISILIGLANLVLPSQSKVKLLGFAFEMFESSNADNNGFETRSTDRLLEMYEVIPHNTKTWLIGDGIFNDPSGQGFYMHTDVGYFRLIFYFGLPATLFFVFVLTVYYKVLASLDPKNGILRSFLFLILLFELICNLKGLAFDSYYFVLFLIFLVLANEKKGRSLNFYK